MLLLVLILVLIAFGLLVVSLLTGTVLSAWVSVGVSVAAAAVLLVDWLQRRAAVRAGAEVAEPVASADPVAPVEADPSRMAALDRSPSTDLAPTPDEPATEALPVVRPSAPGATGEATVAGDDWRDERPDTRETVVLRAFAPSGSAGQPPGAHGGIGPTDPNSSRSVTAAGGSHRGPDPSSGPGYARPDDGRGAPPASGPDAETTVTVSGATGHDPGTRADGGAVWSAPAAAAPSGGTARQDLPPLGPDGAPPEEPHDADAAARVATLEDEVLVVDELPRYHLSGCGSLAGTAVIPLPAREAVELGFSPCAWCTPDRTLASRNRAPVR